MQYFKITDKQAQTIANSIIADIQSYCNANTQAFEEFKKNLIEKENLKNETKSSKVIA